MEKLLSTLILGIATGAIYSLAATGLVLTYRISGVLNFGFGSVAMFGGFLHWQLAFQWGWPVWLSALFVLVVAAPLLGLFLDSQLFSRIQGQPMVISIIATVGLTVLLQGVVFLIWGSESHRLPSLFPQRTFRLLGGVSIASDDIAIFAVAAAAAAGLAVMFRYTRLGVAFRAVVDNRPVAGLMSINTGLVSGLAWAIGTSFAALTGILVASTVLLDPIFMPFFVISQVVGAAIIGYMRSLPMAFAGGLILGVAQSAVIRYLDLGGVFANLENAVPFIIVVIAVLLAPKALRVSGAGTSFVVRTRELAARASQAAHNTVAGGTFGLLALMPVLAAGSISWKFSLLQAMSLAIIFLSLVILTGYSGQISLGHSAFMGIAVFTASYVGVDLGLSMWLAIPLGAIAAVPAGALLGVIAVRLHGLFLALMTLGFAFVVQNLFFSDPRISGGFRGVDVPRPAGARGTDAFYYLVLAALAGAALLAVNLRTGRTGRVLAAMRDSETASRALGINVVKYKVVIFSLSAFIAGIGAILYAMIIQQAGQGDFIPFISVFYVTIAVLGGIFHVGGAIVSGLLVAVYPQLFGNVEILSRLQFILFGLGATLALAQNPEGVFGELRRGGAFLLRALERRRAGRAPVPVTGGQR